MKNISWSLWNMGNMAEALQITLMSLNQYPDYTDLKFLASVYYLHGRDFNNAMRLCDEAIKDGDCPKHFISSGGTGTWRAMALKEQIQIAMNEMSPKQVETSISKVRSNNGKKKKYRTSKSR